MGDNLVPNGLSMVCKVLCCGVTPGFSLFVSGVCSNAVSNPAFRGGLKALSRAPKAPLRSPLRPSHGPVYPVMISSLAGVPVPLVIV